MRTNAITDWMDLNDVDMNEDGTIIIVGAPMAHARTTSQGHHP